jgi:type I restriction enzyme, R subunit
MNKVNIISENPNSTVVSEYKEVNKKSTSFQSEAELENEFIKLYKNSLMNI